MRDYNMVTLGRLCRRARRRRDLTQKQVAVMTGYSIENICGFEHGRTSNAKLLVWYIVECGLTVNELREGVTNGAD